ncbi:hypothetical protein PAAG_02349 [Paracoccidioides lutzii Pb01]|uniref:Uncharacterized protein n=1 Tax=Paracoccidioides lutzii (strain ATCC MYA-826 / Pb01) TaxID=502779 RepID=C1GUM6_PARBA|nr:hypothetical protein PAAG_02349 [Paracoccidioides lutzii Pb01]EEH40294.2 hypothetical protein PAAG_02349 [Paracoccidioides lutzii Pb01]
MGQNRLFFWTGRYRNSQGTTRTKKKSGLKSNRRYLLSSLALQMTANAGSDDLHFCRESFLPRNEAGPSCMHAVMRLQDKHEDEELASGYQVFSFLLLWFSGRYPSLQWALQVSNWVKLRSREWKRDAAN